MAVLVGDADAVDDAVLLLVGDALPVADGDDDGVPVDVAVAVAELVADGDVVAVGVGVGEAVAVTDGVADDDGQQCPYRTWQPSPQCSAVTPQ